VNIKFNYKDGEYSLLNCIRSSYNEMGQLQNDAYTLARVISLMADTMPLEVKKEIAKLCGGELVE
jgi:hypothetical protein